MMFSGPTELQMLAWSMVLGLVQLVLATALATRDQGLAYNLSPRDAPAPSITRISARLARAFRNFLETFVFFAAAVLAVTLAGKANATSALGATLYFWARLVYVPVYASGIPLLRTMIWTVSIVGLVMVLSALA